jgi:hypothetical protein
MPLPEGYLPRKGDIVLVQARAKRDTNLDVDSEGYFEIIGQEHCKFFMDVSAIHSLHCRRWNEGDRVKSIEFDGPGLVIGISDEWVWVLCETGEDEGGRYTLTANEPYIEPKSDEFKIDPQWEADPIKPDPILDGMLHATPGSQSIVGDDEAIEG